MDLILYWDNELIRISLIDAGKEIEAILRGVIDGLKACRLTKQTGRNLMQNVLNYLNNFCRVLHTAGIERTQINCKETRKKILLTLEIPWVLGPIKLVVVMAV